MALFGMIQDKSVDIKGMLKMKGVISDSLDASEIENYTPELSCTADIKLKDSIKDWIKSAFSQIADNKDIYAFEINLISHGLIPEGETDWRKAVAAAKISICYGTEKGSVKLPKWNFSHYNNFGYYEYEYLKTWLESGNYSLEESDRDRTHQRLADILVVAVSELHKEEYFEKNYGKKLPIVIQGFSNDGTGRLTAMLSVKANGIDCFDKEFFKMLMLKIV